MQNSQHFSAEECLALVERSPEAVAAQDKDAWLALFARYSLIEDPVGSAAHIVGTYDRRSGYRSRACLERFFDTFIAPNTIQFHIDRDIVCGLHVVRDLTIEITMSERVVVHVPVHLLYELTVEDGALKIRRLAAHWELGPMLKQQIASGMAFLPVGCAAGARMLRHQGVTGMAGFMRALASVGTAGKEQTTRFLNAFNAGDAAALEALFAHSDVEIAFPYGAPPATVAAAVGQGGEMRFSKVLAAGNVVSTAFSYRIGTDTRYGVALFELDRRNLYIVALSFYWS